jgi:hypothetical protein
MPALTLDPGPWLAMANRRPPSGLPHSSCAPLPRRERKAVGEQRLGHVPVLLRPWRRLNLPPIDEFANGAAIVRWARETRGATTPGSCRAV